MKKLIYLIILLLILGLTLTGCLLSNVGQVPATGQKGMPLSTANLIALWHFDEDSGAIAYDSTANGNDGTISGTSWVDGKLGKALNFDGNDYVIVPDSSLLEPDRITVEAWVKKSGTPGSYRYIVSKYLPTKPGGYSSYGLYTASSGGLRFYLGLSSTWVASPDAGTGVWDGNWHHVAGTYDGSAVKLYVDGGLVAGAGSTTSDIEYEGTGNLFIGAYTTASYCFSGTIDEVRIWDGALTEEEIMYSYDDETLHVDDDWLQWPGAYYTINEALAVAVNGDTIIVHEGTYGESPVIDKNVTLLGAKHDIDPAGSTDRGGESIITGQVQFISTGSGATLNGFKLDGNRVYVNGASGATVSYNIVVDSSMHGIRLDPSSPDTQVLYNTVSNPNWEGICNIVGNSGVIISHNHITGVTDQPPIVSGMHTCTDIEITYNVISNCTGSKGINYWGGPNAVISHNEISGTTLEAIFSDTRVTIEGNEISDCMRGVSLYPGTDESMVSDNEISDCDDGIYINGANKIDVLENEISGSTYEGIVVWWSNDILIEENEISDSGYAGIKLGFSHDNDVLMNEVTDSTYEGILLFYESSGNLVEENEVKGSNCGIVLKGGASNNEVVENEVKDSEIFDLYWDGSGTGNTWMDNEYETSNF